MAFVDTGNLTSGLDWGSILRKALGGALPAVLGGSGSGGASAPAAAPAAATPSNPALTAQVQTALAQLLGPTPTATPAPTPAAPAYNPNNDKTYSQRFASGGTLGPKTVDASTLTSLPLETLHAADPSKNFGQYYGAYTDHGDLAATLMAQPGAKTQLIDPSTGQVVAEGVGPQGSQEIASLASAISQKLGKQATWDIAQETGSGTGQYQTFYGDRVDKPRFTLLSALKMVAPAALGMLLGPEVGGLVGSLTGGAVSGSLATGLGSGLTAFGTGMAEGEKPLQAALGGLGAGAGGFIGAGGLGGAAGGAGGAGGTAADWAALTSGNIPSSAISALGSAPWYSGLGLGVGTAAGDAAGSVLGNGLPNAAGGATSIAGGDLGTVLDPLTVTAPSAGGGIGAAGGAGLGALPSGLAGGWSGTPDNAVSPEVEVTPKTSSPGPTINAGGGLGAVGDLTPSPGGNLAPKLESQPSQTNKDSQIGKNIGDFLGNLLNRPSTSPQPTDSDGGRNNRPDPFTPGGGSTSPGPGTQTQQPGGGTPGGPGTPAIHSTSPSFSAPAPGNVSGTPFGGGAGPAALGSINLKGSAAPDIYPWQTVV